MNYNPFMRHDIRCLMGGGFNIRGGGSVNLRFF